MRGSHGGRLLARMSMGLAAVVVGAAAVVVGAADAAGAYHVDSLQGSDRHATAAMIGDASYPEGADTVYITTGRDYPDGLAGGVLAGREGGPVLLTEADRLPQPTREALERLGPSEAVILGGTAAVGSAVEESLAAAVGTVTRLSGSNRFETADRIAARAGDAEVAYIATGANFPDALSASAAAVAREGALLLSARTELPPATGKRLLHLAPDEIVILGGRHAISDRVQSQLRGYTDGPVRRVSGADRYATSAAVSRDTFASAEHVYLALGGDFPDALAGGPAAGREDGPLLLSRGDCAPAAVLQEIDRLSPDRVTLLGATAAMSSPAGGLERCAGDDAPTGDAPSESDADGDGDLDGPSDPEAPDPSRLGDDPTLDELADRCEAGDWQACDALYRISPPGSDYQEYGDTCGQRRAGGRWCIDEYGDDEAKPGEDAPGGDPALDGLFDRCADGDWPACDDLYRSAPPDSTYELYGDTCGGRNAPQGWCVDVYGGSEDEPAPHDLGTDPHLTGLAQQCAEEDWAACDDLFRIAPADSDYRRYGDTCGWRQEAPGPWCEDAFGDDADDAGDSEVPWPVGGLGGDPQRNALAADCHDGEWAACDDLYRLSDPDSDYRLYGATCGGRQAPEAGWCVETLGEEEPEGVPWPTGGLGEDPELDTLAEHCHDGQWEACDDLFRIAPSGSLYRRYGDTCAGRQDTGQGWCVDAELAA